MYKKLIIASTFILISLSVPAQTSHRRNYFPAWTYHQKDINIHGISVGFGSGITDSTRANTNGIKLEVPGIGIIVPLAPKSPIAQNDSAFAGLLKEPVSERINGISISALGTVCDCITNGINLGLIAHLNYIINGLTFAAEINYAQKVNGAQMTILFNESFSVNGLQIGAHNRSHHMKGLQIGVVNKTKKLRGIQLGIWNINERRKLPLINWNFRTKPEERQSGMQSLW